MSNRIIELHNSTVSTITIEDRSAIVNFSAAYIHKSEGNAGVDAGTGWIQAARLVIKESSMKGQFISGPDTILDGVLWVGDVEHSNFIPIPFDTLDAVRLHLEFASGNHVTLTGKGATLELFGDPKFIEEFVP
jgi:hypothetical protein